MSVPEHPSLSLFRGQSRVGIGEGPGVPIAHGEQYLAADPPLGDDRELLDRIRPWFTLDSTPSDRRSLGERIESWSCFEEGGFLFVVRLCAAEVYDRRAAYFAHGRAWRLDELGEDEDPGFLVGWSEAFEPPWRDGRREATLPEPELGPPRVQLVKDGRELAEKLLASLVQARAAGKPLIFAVALEQLAAGSRVHQLVSFARAALPQDLKRGCRLRIYTRQPGFYLQRLGADLVVVPLEAVADALRERPDATVMDGDGRVRSGPERSSLALAYAREVTKRAIALPEELAGFCHRFSVRRGHRGVPTEAERQAVPLVYNLGYALRQPRERMGELLGYLERNAALLARSRSDWQRWITAEEWGLFPRRALSELLLKMPESLGEGVGELQAAVEEAASRLGLRLERPPGRKEQKAELTRYLDLYDRSQPLVNAEDVAALTRNLPTAKLAATGRPAAALRAELEAGTLGDRRAELTELATLAADPGCLEILLRATSKGVLEPAWAVELVQRAGSRLLLRVARELLAVAPDDGLWDEVQRHLLDRLRILDPPPAGLIGLLGKAARSLELRRDPALSLRLADLLRRLSPGGEAPRGLLEPLLEDLLALGEKLGEGAGEVARETRELFFQELDRRLQKALPETTEALVRTGWWFFWRRESRLGSAELRRAALEWLSSPAWGGGDAPEATMETWSRVVEDLSAQGLNGEDMRALCRGSARCGATGPAIPPFEQRQLDDLAGLATDCGALAELASGWRGASLARVAEERFGVGEGALGWLRDGGGGGEGSLPVLSLEESARLLEVAGNRRDAALAARRAAVLHHLAPWPEEACRHADASSLWTDPTFLGELRQWLILRGARALDDPRLLGALEGALKASVVRLPRAGGDEALARQALAREAPWLAELLARGVADAADREKLLREALEALRAGNSAAGCWKRLSEEITRHSRGEVAGRHPVTALADLARTGRDPWLEHTWSTFLEVAARLPTFLGPDTRGHANLPCLDLAAVLLESVPLGDLALRLVFFPASDDLRGVPGWWDALVASLGHCQRRGGGESADDRVALARALLVCTAGRLPEADRVSLARALDTTIRTDGGRLPR